MDVVEHKRYEHSDDYRYYCRGYVRLIEKQHDGEYEEDDGHQSARKSIESIGDVYGIDDCDSDEESEYGRQQSEIYLACNRPEIDIIYSQPAIKPSADECGKDHHTDQFRFSAKSFYLAMSFDIEEIIYKSDQSHTEETKENDIGFLPVE